MVCIYCAGKTQIGNSRARVRSNSVWRRRSCLTCQAVFTSIETPELSSSLLVQKNDDYQPFVREKLYISIYNALSESPRRYEHSTQLTSTVIGKLLAGSHGSAIPQIEITNCCSSTLKRFDSSAYLRYVDIHASSSVRVLVKK